MGRLWLKAFGWKTGGGVPGVRKAVVVAAPHTSNWDFPFTMAVAWSQGMHMKWVGKHTLFRFPFGGFMRSIGGIALDRNNSKNFTQQVVDLINESDDLLVVIAPEGTRSKVQRWRTGFYHMARGANVPIILGYLDFPNKTGGLGEVFVPTGDLEHDAQYMRDFYANIRGKNGNQTGEITFAEAPQAEEAPADAGTNGVPSSQPAPHASESQPAVAAATSSPRHAAEA